MQQWSQRTEKKNCRPSKYAASLMHVYFHTIWYLPVNMIYYTLSQVVIKAGVKATWSLCDTFKDLLPFPGNLIKRDQRKLAVPCLKHTSFCSLKLLLPTI